jgi:hypothetical protein
VEAALLKLCDSQWQDILQLRINKRYSPVEASYARMLDKMSIKAVNNARAADVAGAISGAAHANLARVKIATRARRDAVQACDAAAEAVADAAIGCGIRLCKRTQLYRWDLCPPARAVVR